MTCRGSPLSSTRFPRFCAEHLTDHRTLSTLKGLEGQSKTGPETERLVKQLTEKLDQLALRLRYDAQCQIEIRFSKLDYDLVWKLQVDDLVDRNLTVKSKASIRIILGTLSQFLREE